MAETIKVVRTYKITVSRDLYVEAESCDEAIKAIKKDLVAEYSFSAHYAEGMKPDFTVNPITKKLVLV